MLISSLTVKRSMWQVQYLRYPLHSVPRILNFLKVVLPWYPLLSSSSPLPPSIIFPGTQFLHNMSLINQLSFPTILNIHFNNFLFPYLSYHYVVSHHIHPAYLLHCPLGPLLKNFQIIVFLYPLGHLSQWYTSQAITVPS